MEKDLKYEKHITKGLFNMWFKKRQNLVDIKIKKDMREMFNDCDDFIDKMSFEIKLK